MLLTIDAGNTNIVLAIFKDGLLLHKWRIASKAERTSDEYAVALTSLLQTQSLNFTAIDAVIIASVVPSILRSLKHFSGRYLNITPVIVGENELNTGITIAIDHPQELGADRLVNSVAAYEKYPHKDLVIIDFGTATTFDILDKDHRYIGGIICPGVHLSAKALHQATAKLPDIDINAVPPMVGTSTITAMQSGLYWGYLSMIEGMLTRIEKSTGKQRKIIATGGLAPLFAKSTDVMDILEPDLTLWGLQILYKRSIS